jgi:type II secretory ATPase GspE/PulE/Tfp pilus assembly ATPase PilB-like protein
VPHKPTPEELESVGLDAQKFFDGTLYVPKVKTSLKPPPPGMVFRANSNGCQRCSKVGYLGRTGIYEMMLIDDEIRQLALKNSDSGRLKKAAVQKGMRTLREDGGLKAVAGITTIEEVLLVTSQDHD